MWIYSFFFQMNSPSSPGSKKTRPLLIGVARVFFWGMANEFLLHFLYFNAIQQNGALMQRLDLWTLAGVGYWSGQFFMNKYTVLYGVPASLARLENLDPPQGPRCVAYIYTYSEMWKWVSDLTVINRSFLHKFGYLGSCKWILYIVFEVDLIIFKFLLIFWYSWFLFRYFDRGMYSFIKRYFVLLLLGQFTTLTVIWCIISFAISDWYNSKVITLYNMICHFLSVHFVKVNIKTCMLINLSSQNMLDENWISKVNMYGNL